MLILTKRTRIFIIKILANKQKGLCAICENKLYQNTFGNTNFHIDHVLPKSKLIKAIIKKVDECRNFDNSFQRKKYIDGLIEENVDCMINLQLLCYDCNMGKNVKCNDIEFKNYVENIIV